MKIEMKLVGWDRSLSVVQGNQDGTGQRTAEWPS